MERRGSSAEREARAAEAIADALEQVGDHQAAAEHRERAVAALVDSEGIVAARYTAMMAGHDIPDLLDAFTTPSWHEHAQCRGHGELFFAADQASVDQARQVCSGCPVHVECADAGEGERGVWGGLSEAERRALRRGAA